MFLAMEYPHWLMVAGALLVALGFIGFAFRQNRNGETVHERTHEATGHLICSGAAHSPLPLKPMEGISSARRAFCEAFFPHARIAEEKHAGEV
jgi:hypothetical protein